jgi:aspartyl-tRNA(Asn)/glutamyl-tRNA(Gln) amidotransferase subunit B
LVEEHEITAYDSDVLVNQGRELVSYFVAVAQGCGDGKAAANWIQQSVLRTLNEDQIGIDQYPLSAEGLAGLIRAVLDGKMETSRGREVLAQMLETGATAEQAMKALGIAEVDESDLETLCAELLGANPKVVEDVKQGKLKAAGSLIGQAKKMNPNVNATRVREICLQLIEQM